jgi:HNH endonuclease
MARLADRFEAKVDRSGDHHVWTGSTKADGTGKLKVEGRTVTAQRVAWELANGPVPAGAEVQSCADRRGCVRVDHLSLRRRVPPGGRTARPRAAKGTGTKIEVRPGVWKLTVTAGRWADGTQRRVHRTVRATTSTEAASELAEFAAEVRNAPLPEARSDRDLTVDEAVERTESRGVVGFRVHR